MHPLDPLNGSKTRLIDVHAEAFALDVIGVASGRIIVIDKLSTAFDADVILLTFFLAVLTDTSRSTLGTLHGRLPLIHTLIMQRPYFTIYSAIAALLSASLRVERQLRPFSYVHCQPFVDLSTSLRMRGQLRPSST